MIAKMRPFLFSWIILCAFNLQKHLTVTATSTYNLPFDNADTLHKLTDYQIRLVNEFSNQISEVLNALNVPEISLEDEDPPAVQNVTSIVEEDPLNGNLFMYNTVIDGLTETEDAIDVVRDKLEIRMEVKLKQLTIHGDYAFETTIKNAEEKGTFSVTLTNVVIKGVATMLADPFGNMVITKVEPTILSEDTHITMKPKLMPSGPVLELAMTHLQNNIQKRFARIATLEVLLNYPKKSGNPITKANRTMFEGQIFVSQRYDPFKFKMISMNDSPTSWQLGPFELHGFSNFHIDEVDMIVTNTSVNIIFRILTDSLWGSFPFNFHKKYVGEYTVTKMDFIGRIKLMADNSQQYPLLDGLGLEMSGCQTRIRNKESGTTVGENEFGFDAEDLFCLLIRNEISTSNVIRTVQAEIFNKVDLKRLREIIGSVIYEDRLLTEAY